MILDGQIIPSRPAAGLDRAWYLHELTIAQGTAWGNSESTRVGTPTMESNGLQAVMTTAGAATPDSLATAFGYTWPITLVRDTSRKALVSPANLNPRKVKLAILERSISVTPTQAGFVAGFCNHADVTASTALFGIGLCNDSTTLRSVIGAKRIAGTPTFQTAGTGQSGAAGAEVTIVPVGVTNTHSSVVVPLDTAFDHGTAGSNTVTFNTANVDISAMTHVFAAFLYTVAAATATPTLRFDFGVQIAPDVQWS